MYSDYVSPPPILPDPPHIITYPTLCFLFPPLSSKGGGDHKKTKIKTNEKPFMKIWKPKNKQNHKKKSPTLQIHPTFYKTKMGQVIISSEDSVSFIELQA